MFTKIDVDNLLDIIQKCNITGASSEYISELKIKVRGLLEPVEEKKKDEANTKSVT